MTNSPNQEGGGASLTTDIAAGTSSATDVSLDRYVSRENWWLDRFYGSEIRHIRELADSRREADQLAIGKALDSAKELAEKHNDLIRTAEKKDESYATKVELNRLEKWQTRLGGAALVIGFIGVTNLAKLWLS